MPKSVSILVTRDENGDRELCRIHGIVFFVSEGQRFTMETMLPNGGLKITTYEVIGPPEKVFLMGAEGTEGIELAELAKSTLPVRVIASETKQGDPLDQPLSELWLAIPAKARNALLRAGFTTIRDLTRCTRGQVESVPRIGAGGLRAIDKFLEGRGLSFATTVEALARQK